MARSQTISLANIHFPPCPPSSPLRVYSVWQTLHSRPLRRKRRSTIHQSSLILTHLDHSSSIPRPRTQISLTRTRKTPLTSPSHPNRPSLKNPFSSRHSHRPLCCQLSTTQLHRVCPACSEKPISQTSGRTCQNFCQLKSLTRGFRQTRAKA